MTEQAGIKVLIMAGGTGGHVFPALAVAELLREKGVQVQWLGTRAGIESRVVEQAGIPISYIQIKGLRGKSRLSLLLAPVKLVIALVQALKVVWQQGPNCVLGLGGFASGPGGVAAWLLGKPLLIHEQNAIAGMTNRWLAPLARRVMAAFPNAFAARKNVVTLGNPLRQSLLKQRLRERDGEVKRLLVFGGSLGARALNEIVPQALKQLDVKLEVRHQSGARTYDMAQQAYQQAGVEAEVVTFIDDMAEAYQWADLVIARSGALSVSEIACAGVPAILVPYPHAVDDHQTANAHWLVDSDAALLMAEKDMTADSLAALLTVLMKDPERVKRMGDNALKRANTQATEQVVEQCLEVAYA